MSAATIPSGSCLQYRTEGEQRMAVALVDLALARGFTVSVNDGEEWTVRRSTDRAEILDAMATTDMDRLRIHDTANGGDAGTIALIYGNDEDGRELVNDYHTIAHVAALVRDAHVQLFPEDASLFGDVA